MYITIYYLYNEFRLRIVIMDLSLAQSVCSWLLAGQSRTWGSIPGRGKEFFLFHSVQTSSGAHPASYPMGTGGSFPGVKRQMREAGLFIYI
jgi:hypothetical protein